MVSVGEGASKNRKRLLVALGLFGVCSIAYNINRDFVTANGTKSNTYLPIAILKHRSLSFTPQDFPFMFIWSVHTPQGNTQVSFNRWSDRADDRSFADYKQTGQLAVVRPKYYLVPTIHEGRYVNTFG